MKKIDVVAALVRDGERFMICKRPQNKARGGLWEFPGGKIEPGETPEEALARELREELDVAAEAGELYLTVEHVYPDVIVELAVYETYIREGTPRLLEHEAIAFITPGEIPEYGFCPADRVILDKISKERNNEKEQ